MLKQCGELHRCIYQLAIALLFAGMITAKAPAETPNFSGVWMGDRARSDNWPADLPYTETGAAAAQAFKKKYPGDTYWPGNFCVNRPMPDLMLGTNYPMEIIQRPERLTILFESRTPVRRIHIDGRAHPERVRASKAGDSIAHWEGDTLVIETIGIKSMLGPRPASKTLRVVERMSIVQDDTYGKSLADEFTIDDPEFYTKPVVLRRYFTSSPNLTMLEYGCTNAMFSDYLRGLEAKRNNTGETP